LELTNCGSPLNTKKVNKLGHKYNCPHTITQAANAGRSRGTPNCKDAGVKWQYEDVEQFEALNK